MEYRYSIDIRLISIISADKPHTKRHTHMQRKFRGFRIHRNLHIGKILINPLEALHRTYTAPSQSKNRQKFFFAGSPPQMWRKPQIKRFIWIELLVLERGCLCFVRMFKVCIRRVIYALGYNKYISRRTTSIEILLDKTKITQTKTKASSGVQFASHK